MSKAADYPMKLNSLPSGLAVRRDPQSTQRFSADESVQQGGRVPLAVVCPKDTKQIAQLISWANAKAIGIVPVSSPAGPRRRGDTVPSSAAAVIADLSEMKQVHHIDERDAVAVIEPGLTFPEFDAQLALHGLRSFKPLLPRRSKSVIASYLEREPITSPREQWDSSDPLVCVEVVFGTGKVFRTGSASVPGTLEENLKLGLRQISSSGPIATDFQRVLMGSQGTLGIVSWGSVYCERIPARERAFFVGSDSLEPLVELSYKINWRRLGAQLFIVNNVHLALMLANDPSSSLRLIDSLPPWILFVNTAAPNYFPEERLAYELSALTADSASLGLTVSTQLSAHPAASVTAMQQNLPDGSYKDRLSGSHDEIFFLTQLDKASPFISTFSELQLGSRAKTPFGVYIQPRVQSSTCHLELTTFSNPRDPDARATQSQFMEAAAARLADQGAFFSRPYGAWNELAYKRDAQIVPYLTSVKAMFDPKRILNPGKLCY